MPVFNSIRSKTDSILKIGNSWMLDAVGPGAKEIRIHVQGEWRIVYAAKFHEAIYVLHAFRKKSRKTSRKDIELARKRYK